MTVRPPSSLGPGASVGEALHDALQHEIMSEKAAALGRAGERAARAVAALRASAPGHAGRTELLGEAARAVQAWFIQRELCGLRRHQDVIRELDIPRAVLARLGAS